MKGRSLIWEGGMTVTRVKVAVAPHVFFWLVGFRSIRVGFGWRMLVTVGAQVCCAQHPHFYHDLARLRQIRMEPFQFRLLSQD